MAGTMRSRCDCCAASNAPHPPQSDPAGLCTASLVPNGGSEPSGPTRGSTKAEKEWAMPLDWVLWRLYLRLEELVLKRVMLRNGNNTRKGRLECGRLHANCPVCWHQPVL
jgi:hypothetical protein